MAARKTSSAEQERMTDTNIAKVIAMLETPADGEKPWTKKEACQFLGMAYNTTRLGTIINTFKEKQARDAKKRAEKRGKPASQDEIIYAIQEYINGEPVDTIAKSLYRSAQFVKTILERNHVPIRAASHDYFRPALIPEGATRDRFSVGEVVYAARYDSTARIEGEVECHKDHGWVYRLWLLGDKWQQWAYQPASELASLEHLRKLGVKV